MKTSILFGGTLAATMLMSSAFAAAEAGPYVGLSIGRAHHGLSRADFDESQPRAGKTEFESNLETNDLLRNGGVALTGGWRFARWYALEGDLSFLGTADYNYRALEPGSQSAERYSSIRASYRAEALSAAAVLRLPITSRFSLVGRVGAVYSRTKEDIRGTVEEGAVRIRTVDQKERESNIAPTFGAGLELEANRHITFGLEWQRYCGFGDLDADADIGTVDTFDIDRVSFSGTWRF